MNSLIDTIIRRKKTILIIFTVIALTSTVAQFSVKINYSLIDYLPESAQSTKALKIMKKAFPTEIPNTNVMISNVGISETLEYKEGLANVEGVTSVTWLDDVINLKEPIEMADKKTVESYYKDNDALITLTIKEGYETDAIVAIYKIIGENGAVSGEALDIATQQAMAKSEPTKAMLILIPIIIVILFLTTSSYIEPILFLVTIGVSVLINLGTNIFLGKISFITLAVSPILQLAVSLDYAIFLLHNFDDFRKQTDDINKAMKLAWRRSFSAITASAATTLFGFAALLFMEFGIGMDLGLNLVKGILLSFLSVVVFLPALTLSCHRIIDKTRHKKIIPILKNAGKKILKIRYIALILVAILIVPAFLAQQNNDFIYGMGSNLSDSRAGDDSKKISENFGQSVAILLLVPRGDIGKEYALSNELSQLERINSVVSYTTAVGAAIPEEYLDESITEQFYSKDYARIILYADTENEGEEAFNVVESVQQKAREYYGENVLSVGQSVNLYDIKNVVEDDMQVVNFIAILAIGLVLLITFRSLSLPLILVLTIESSIWINLAIPYFTADPLCYIGFLVINTVQLGATVDYAILLTDHYMANRKLMNKKTAAINAIGGTINSLIVSCSILTASGLTLYFVSSDKIISELGLLLARGALLSIAMVLLVLPAILLLLDKLIGASTLKANFFKGGSIINE